MMIKGYCTSSLSLKGNLHLLQEGNHFSLAFYLQIQYPCFCLLIPQIPETKPHSGTKAESPEGYYEEAEPYGISTNGTELLSACYKEFNYWTNANDSENMVLIIETNLLKYTVAKMLHKFPGS